MVLSDTHGIHRKQFLIDANKANRSKYNGQTITSSETTRVVNKRHREAERGRDKQTERQTHLLTYMKREGEKTY